MPVDTLARVPRSRRRPRLIRVVPEQVPLLRFLRLLKWLDGRPLLPLLPPAWIEILREVFECQPDGLLKFLRVLILMGKKNGKSLMAMVIALYFCAVWKPAGNKGNQVYVLANDKDQARDDLTLLKKLVLCNPMLLAELTIKGDVVERKDGQGFIQILPAGDAIGMHGKSYLLAVFDEIHGMKNYDVLQAMELDRSRPDAMQWFCSYASLYRHAGIPLIDMQRQHEAGTDPRLYVRNFSGSIEAANPAMDTPLGGTRAAILQALQSLPSWVSRRLYLNQPGQPDSAAYDYEALESRVVTGRTVLPPRPGISHKAGCDLSGGGADDAVLAIACEQAGVAVLECLVDQGVRVNRRFSPDDTVTKFALVLKQYGLTEVCGDRYAALWPVEAFAKHGIRYRPAELNRSQIYTNFEPLLNSGRVELLDHPKLLQQFVGLVRKGEKIDHPTGEHDDHCNAAALACVLAAQPHQAPASMIKITGF